MNIVAIIGDNGTGKTTLLKKSLMSLFLWTVVLSSLEQNVEIGYYDQEHHVLHMDKTLFDEISDDYPYLTNTEIRNTLAAFLFTGEDVFKKISALSGGERGRVSLAKSLCCPKQISSFLTNRQTTLISLPRKSLRTALGTVEK